jgi:hypothetical protein
MPNFVDIITVLYDIIRQDSVLANRALRHPMIQSTSFFTTSHALTMFDVVHTSLCISLRKHDCSVRLFYDTLCYIEPYETRHILAISNSNTELLSATALPPGSEPGPAGPGCCHTSLKAPPARTLACLLSYRRLRLCHLLSHRREPSGSHPIFQIPPGPILSPLSLEQY